MGLYMFQRKALAAAISAASLYGAGCGSAFAEDAATPEIIYVTGSYIGRDQFESASPVSVYQAQDLAESGATSLDEFLYKQPEFGGYSLGTSTNNGNNGAKMVDLRGLGHKRTLVLINGQRQVGSFVGSALDLGAVDLNTIPMAMVERVEVLEDGEWQVSGKGDDGRFRLRLDGVRVSSLEGMPESAAVR